MNRLSLLVPAALSALATLLLLFALPSPLHGQQQDLRECNLTTTGEIAIPDAAGLFYRRVGLVPEYAAASGGPEWRQVGLYGNGLTTRPAAHKAAGIAIAQNLTPINEKIVMISIGMSNTWQEFGRFESRAESDNSVSTDLVIINGSQGGRPADVWTSPNDETWNTLDDRLAAEGLLPEDVRVAWIKHAVRSPQFPPLDFPAHPETLQTMLEAVVTSLKTRYPNVVLTYFSSRTRAYNTNQMAQSPEPASYEGAFAVQWMIEKQIAGDASLRYDGVDPPAPWLSWGPYLWTDGTGAPENDPPSPFDARSDGFIWTCADVQRDGVHPSPPTPDADPPEGEFKVGDQLFAFFTTDLTTAPWFLRSIVNGPTISALTANGTNVQGGGSITGQAPFSVNFAATVTGNLADVSWTFSDGTFSYEDAGNSSGMPFFDDNLTPTKVFEVAGDYDVCFAARSGPGNTSLECFTVTVTGAASAAPDDVPGAARLAFAAHPNPFNPITTFDYTLPRASSAKIDIFDSAGRLILRLDQGQRQAGRHRATWRGLDRRGNAVASGTYSALLRAGNQSSSLKLVLAR